MKNTEEVEELIRVIGQCEGLYKEISQLAKKSSNDGINAFKLKFINKIIVAANQVLGDEYKPFPDFSEFDFQEVPTNSDVTMITSQYLVQLEKFRSDSLIYENHTWRYSVGGQPSDIKSPMPKKIGGAIE